MAGIKEWFGASFVAHDWAWGLIIAFAGGLLLSLTPVWQLVAIAGGIGGLVIRKKAGIAWWVGFIGVALAWLVIVVAFVILGPAWKMMDLFVAIIAGSSGLAAIGLALTLVIGGVVGGGAGFLGFSIAAIIRTARNKEA